MTLHDRLQLADMQGLSDADAATRLNAPDPALGSVRKKVATQDALRLLLQRGLYPGILFGSEATNTNAQTRAACVLVCKSLDSLPALDTDVQTYYDAINNCLGVLVTAGILSTPDQSDLMALANRNLSWAEANGVVVDEYHVSATRARGQ